MALAANYSRWILDRLRPSIGKHILEVGAGVGSFSKFLLETSPESMTLLEPSPNLFAILTERLPGIDARGIAVVRVHIRAIARIKAKTGVEMEALTAVSVAALTIYDMCKAIDKTMTIDGVRLVKKTGGSSFSRPARGARSSA